MEAELLKQVKRTFNGKMFKLVHQPLQIKLEKKKVLTEGWNEVKLEFRKKFPMFTITNKQFADKYRAKFNPTEQTAIKKKKKDTRNSVELENKLYVSQKKYELQASQGNRDFLKSAKTTGGGLGLKVPEQECPDFCTDSHPGNSDSAKYQLIPTDAQVEMTFPPKTPVTSNHAEEKTGYVEDVGCSFELQDIMRESGIFLQDDISISFSNDESLVINGPTPTVNDVIEKPMDHTGPQLLDHNYPQACVPGPTVPQATVPGPTVPHAPVPGLTVPLAPVPGPTVPHAPVPGLTVPLAPVPGPTVPQARALGPAVAPVPGPTVPQARAPGPAVAHIPGPTVPQARVPRPAVAHLHVPGPTVPQARFPGPAVAQVRVPGSTVPQARVHGPLGTQVPLLRPPTLLYPDSDIDPIAQEQAIRKRPALRTIERVRIEMIKIEGERRAEREKTLYENHMEKVTEQREQNAELYFERKEKEVEERTQKKALFEIQMEKEQLEVKLLILKLEGK